MEENPAILLCYAFDGQGHATAIPFSELKAEDPRFIWVHVNGRHAETEGFLRQQAGLDPLIIRSLLAEETRPRLEEIGDRALIMLRGVNFNPGPEPEDLVSIRLWISGNRLITVGRRKSHAIWEMNDRIEDGHAPRHIGEFVAVLCALLNEGLEPAINELDATIDELEDISLENPDAKLRQRIAAARKQATLFRRHMAPQRDVFNRLQTIAYPWLQSADKWLMQDNHDRILNFLEDLDSIRERAQILQDELYSALSVKLNKNLYVISIITVIFMPLSFVTGLLGMNVEGLPGAKDPYAFMIVCGLLMAVAGVQVLIFRRLKWV